MWLEKVSLAGNICAETQIVAMSLPCEGTENIPAKGSIR